MGGWFGVLPKADESDIAVSFSPYLITTFDVWILLLMFGDIVSSSCLVLDFASVRNLRTRDGKYANDVCKMTPFMKLFSFLR
jgi:hypothetical protein